MSQENVEAFERAAQAINARDIDGLIAEVHPDVEWHPVMLASLAGSATVYRGHDGVRDWIRDVDESFDGTHSEFPDIEDMGDRLVAFGTLRARGKGSGVEVESPIVYVADFKDGKAILVRTYLDRREAMEAAGLEE
jgi:ketosteroid isomerase-like protein